MKRVGILTFHYGDNYGAILQCYALRRTINDWPSYEAEIINYIPDNDLEKRIMASYYDKEAYLEKKEKLESFRKEYCGLSECRVQCVTGEEYDYLCVGSDQVWNPIFSDEEYYLSNVCKGKKVSYAASLGKPVRDCKYYADMYKHKLADFDYLSVREIEHVDFLRAVTGKECVQVLDPTLLLKSDDYEEIMDAKEPEKREYILFYWLKDNDVLMRGLELVNSIARKYKLKIIHTIMGEKAYMFSGENKCMYYGGVEDFLWYIKHAKVVVTNSYHAMLFSIQFHVPFYVLGREKMRARIDTLNTMFDIRERIVETYKPIHEISMEMNYERIDRILEKERIRSLEVLHQMLEL